MARVLFFLAAWTACSIGNSYGQYPNIQISTANFPNEPAILFNPKNMNQMVAGANIASFYYSNDAGMSWGTGTLTSSYGVWGDPCIVTDSNGTFYYFHLNHNTSGPEFDQIVCQRSLNGGVTWDNGSVFGKNGDKWQEKPWAVVDPETNSLYVTWTQNDDWGSPDPQDSSNILFSRSTDEGLTWSAPVRINQVAGHCTNDGYGVNGPMPAVGANGELLATWVGPLGVMFTKSLDKGLTWPATNVTVATLPVGWGCFIPGIYRAPGFPVICCDRSGGPYHGTIYLSWWDQRNGPDDTDVWFTKSTDGGDTWTPMTRVNDDPPGNQQFFSWMTVDQVTGYLYFVFYDRRQYSDLNTDVYMAVSTNGGQTFQNFRISESPFAPNASIFIGDYNNIYAHDNVVRPIWTRMSNDNLSIWTAKVDSINLGLPPEPGPEPPFVLKQNYPNPTLNYTNFAYKVSETSPVSLRIYNLFGYEVATVFENKMHSPGQYVYRYMIDRREISPGLYFYSLSSRNRVVHKKMMVE